jgi:hypothetical protein
MKKELITEKQLAIKSVEEEVVSMTEIGAQTGINVIANDLIHEAIEMTTDSIADELANY